MPKHSNTIYQRTKTFLKKAKSIHNDKYDYSLVEYVNWETQVIIVCYEHGEFKPLKNVGISEIFTVDVLGLDFNNPI